MPAPIYILSAKDLLLAAPKRHMTAAFFYNIFLVFLHYVFNLHEATTCHKRAINFIIDPSLDILFTKKHV